MIGRTQMNLQQFSLTISCFNLEVHKGIENLTLQMSRSITTLQSLALHISHLPAESLKTIGNHVCKGMRKLERLSLNFECCRYANDDNCIQLISRIGKYSRNLKQLILRFTDLQIEITDQVMETIAFQISNLTELQQLKIEFKNSPKLTDKGLRLIGSKFAQNLRKLKKLELLFNGCNGFTEPGLEGFVSEINSPSFKLKELSLSFPCLSKMSKNKRGKLKQKLSSISKLNF